MNKNGDVELGINHFLTKIIGKIDKIEFKPIGTSINRGDILLTVCQNGKKLNLISPIYGKINSLNDNVIKNPILLNKDPYNKWVYNLTPKNWKRDKNLMYLSDKIKEWFNLESIKIKDFILNKESYILQDGGYLNDNILENYNAEVWENFQSFIDKNL